MKKNPQFKIKKTKNDQYHFTLVSKNGRVILSSETYTTKQNAEKGILSVIDNSGKLEIEKQFKILKSKDDKFYFNMIAGNGEIIGTSETYTKKHNCVKGINSVINNSIKIHNDAR